MNKLNKTLRKITTGLRLMLVLGCLIAPMVSAQHPAAASTARSVSSLPRPPRVIAATGYTATGPAAWARSWTK